MKHFLLIFDIFRNVNSNLNAVISVYAVYKCTWHISKCKVDIIEQKDSCLSVKYVLPGSLHCSKHGS